jgi:hypothetical protein
MTRILSRKSESILSAKSFILCAYDVLARYNMGTKNAQKCKNDARVYTPRSSTTGRRDTKASHALPRERLRSVALTLTGLASSDACIGVMFKLKDRVKRIGAQEVFTVENIHEPDDVRLCESYHKAKGLPRFYGFFLKERYTPTGTRPQHRIFFRDGHSANSSSLSFTNNREATRWLSLPKTRCSLSQLSLNDGSYLRMPCSRSSSRCSTRFGKVWVANCCFAIFPEDFPSCYDSAMSNLVILFIHFLATLARLLGPGGVRSIVAESLILRHQLLIGSSSRPHLSTACAKS